MSLRVGQVRLYKDKTLSGRATAPMQIRKIEGDTVYYAPEGDIPESLWLSVDRNRFKYWYPEVVK